MASNTMADDLPEGDPASPPQTGPPRRSSVAKFACIIGALALAWFAFLVLLHALKTGEAASQKIADDAYYYFQIAYNAAHGQGLSEDGIASTNGFHPLWLLTLLPGSLIARNRDQALLLDHVMTAVWCAAAVGTIAAAVKRATGRGLGLFALALLLFPPYFTVLSRGMESGESVAFVAAFALSIMTGLDRRRVWLPGLLLGLAVLSRLDNAFLLLAFEMLLIDRLRRDRDIRSFLIANLPLLALLGAFGLWNQLTFGHIVPISGALKSSFPTPHFFSEWLLSYPEFAILLLPSWIGVALARRSDRTSALARAMTLLSIAGTVHLLYTVSFVKWAVFDWDFAAYLPGALLGSALILKQVEKLLNLKRALTAVATIFAILFATLGIQNALQLDANFQVSARNAARWASFNLPGDSILAMKDSGIFTYNATQRVMNLDGLVNTYQYSYDLCSGRQATFLSQHGVAYIVHHAAIGQISDGTYSEFRLIYPCHLFGGASRALLLRKSDEVYRGPTYIDNNGVRARVVIWKYVPEIQPSVQPAAGPAQ